MGKSKRILLYFFSSIRIPMKMIHSAKVLATLSFLALMGCDAVEGDAGPAGPAGNANVMSYTLSVPPSAWTELGAAGTPGHMYSALVDTFSVLNSDIASTGMVLVYRIRSDIFQTVYIPLPCEDAEAGFTRRWEFLYAPGSIGFTVMHDDNNTLQPTATENFKIVLATSLNGKRAGELEQMEYEEAMAALGVE
jgi:hypothetical protein